MEDHILPQKGGIIFFNERKVMTSASLKGLVNKKNRQINESRTYAFKTNSALAHSVFYYTF